MRIFRVTYEEIDTNDRYSQLKNIKAAAQYVFNEEAYSDLSQIDLGEVMEIGIDNVFEELKQKMPKHNQYGDLWYREWT